MTWLTLSRGALRCAIAPALGGAVAGLWFDRIAVLRPPPEAGLASVRAAGSFPLLPYSNRIGGARLVWDGRPYSLLPNFAPEPHAIHGVGWQRPWRIVQEQSDAVRLLLHHEGDNDWPFSFEATQTFRLDASGLELDLVLTNRAGHAAPAGIGWHPYFAKRAGSRLRFAAAGRWEMAPDKLPTQRLPLAGLQANCATLDIDHCFDGWGGTVLLEDDLLRTTLSSDLDHLVVFTQPARDFVAIEPVSHVNNALQLGEAQGVDVRSLGLRVLQPGQSVEAQMRIAVQPV